MPKISRTNKKWNSIKEKEAYYKSRGLSEDYNKGIIKEEIVEQFKYRFDLYTVLGEASIKAYEEFLKAKDLSMEFILACKDMGMKQCIWNSDFFVADLFNRTDNKEEINQMRSKWSV